MLHGLPQTFLARLGIPTYDPLLSVRPAILSCGKNAKQAAKVLEQCNAMLGCPAPVRVILGHQLADNPYCVQGAAKSSSNLPVITTCHDDVLSSLLHKSEHVHSTQDICTNDDKLLPMKKRPFRAIATSEAQSAAESTVMASYARNLSASQEAQPSKPCQTYNGVAMDPSIILKQAGAMANAAEATTAMSYLKTSPQAAQAETHAPTCTQACFPIDAQQSTEAFSLSSRSAPCDVGIGTRTADLHDARYLKRQATAGPKAQTQAQQNVLVGLLYHYTATRGPEWMLCWGSTA
ncbi:TPA: hypothetical protein ACH3X2_005054 [Trebouxia sp. C0005]